MSLQSIPDDIFSIIFSYIDGPTLFSIERTCKAFYFASSLSMNMQSVWRSQHTNKFVLRSGSSSSRRHLHHLKSFHEPKKSQFLEEFSLEDEDVPPDWRQKYKSSELINCSWIDSVSSTLLLEGHKGAVHAMLTISHLHNPLQWKHIISGSADKTIRMRTIEGDGYSLRTTHPTGTVWNTPSSVRSLCLLSHETAELVESQQKARESYGLMRPKSSKSNENKAPFLASGHSDGSLLLWSLMKASPIQSTYTDSKKSLAGSGRSSIRSMKLHIDNESILSCGNEAGDLFLFDIRAASPLIHHVKAHSDGIRCLAFASSNTLISASNDGLVRLTDLRKPSSNFRCHSLCSGPISSLVVSSLDNSEYPDCYAACNDGVVRKFSADLKTDVISSFSHTTHRPSQVTDLDISAKSQRFLLSSCGSSVKVWDLHRPSSPSSASSASSSSSLPLDAPTQELSSPSLVCSFKNLGSRSSPVSHAKLTEGKAIACANGYLHIKHLQANIGSRMMEPIPLEFSSAEGLVNNDVTSLHVSPDTVAVCSWSGSVFLKRWSYCF